MRSPRYNSIHRYDTDDALAHMYNRLNQCWFKGRLPADTTVKWRKRLGAMGMYSPGSPDKIELDRSIQGLPRVIEWVMLHEMAHAAIGDAERAHHGPLWLKLMKRLVRIGAFDGLL